MADEIIPIQLAISAVAWLIWLGEVRDRMQRTKEKLPQLEKYAPWLVLGLLLAFFGRLLSTAVDSSVTFDEILHILHGVLYWQHDPLYSVVQNPPLVNVLIGLPVSLLFHPNLPLDWPVWQTLNWLEISKAFIWEANDNGLQLIFVGRLAIMWVAMLFGALVYRWSGQLARSRPMGLLALFLFTFDPNLLAHGSLATTDLGTAFFLALAGYLVWRYWSVWAYAEGHRRWLGYGGAGLGIGLALAAKFSGVILFPALVLMAVYRWAMGSRRGRVLARYALEIGGWFLIGGLVFLLVYRFAFEALSTDYTWQQAHQLSGHSAYLLGELRTTGWWYYFPLVFAIKTPLATLALVVITVVVLLKNRWWQWEIWWPLLLAGGIFGAGLTSRVNIGYRYLLPMLPLLFVVVGMLTRPLWLKKRKTAVALAALLLLGLLETIWIHPHYLAYFNALAGGPDNGWHIVVDSNIDWGQDIQRLGTYMAEQGIDEVYLSFLGTALPEAYGVQAEMLPAWPIDQDDLLREDFYPDRPAPGTYVLSVTQLKGIYLEDKTQFAWFAAREPQDKVGYSLLVYDVEPEGEPVSTAVSGIGVSNIAPADYLEAFQSNDVRVSRYDARTSVLWPAGNPHGEAVVWTAVGDGHWPQHPALHALYPPPANQLKGIGVRSPAPEVELRYTLLRWDKPLTERLVTRPFFWTAEPQLGTAAWSQAHALTSPPIFDDTFELLGYEIVSPSPPTAGQPLELISYWQVRQPPTHEAKIFVHLIDETGAVVSQHDGLDVQVAGLQTGDAFAQLHAIPTHDLPAGLYGLQMGLYDPASSARLRVDTSAQQVDRLLLETLRLGSGDEE